MAGLTRNLLIKTYEPSLLEPYIAARLKAKVHLFAPLESLNAGSLVNTSPDISRIITKPPVETIVAQEMLERENKLQL